MLLLDYLFFSRIRLLLRELGVILLLLLLDSLPVLLLVHAKLILLLLVLPIQFGVRGWWNDEAWRSRRFVRMDCRRRTWAIGLLGWNALLLGSIQPGFFGGGFELRRLLPGLVVSGSLSCILLDSFRGGLLLDSLLLCDLLFGFFRCRLLIL